METPLVPIPAAPLAPSLGDQARAYVAAGTAANTQRARRTDWADFSAWCAAQGREALPATPDTVALYVTDRAATLKPATLTRRLGSVSLAHQAAGHESPTRTLPVRSVLKGVRRTHGTAPLRVAPLRVEELRRLVATCGKDPAGLRDRALLLLGFAAALRRSELVGLDREDVTETAEGLVVTLRRSKTDQEGRGRQIGVPSGRRGATCPVWALRDWLAVAEITTGPLFVSINRHGQAGGRLTAQSVALIVKARCAAAGLDPERFSGHSLRAGLATSAAAAGASERSIMAQTGHRSEAMVRRYIREGSLFRENAARAVGL
jgi:integrase